MALVDRLVSAVPNLRPLLEELRGAGLGEQLPWLFLDQAARTLTGRVAAGDATARADLIRMAKLLDAESGRDRELDELISSGFLSFLPYL
jgi:hypothetical protein